MDPVDSPGQQLREALEAWKREHDRPWDIADIVAVLVEAGWGPTAAHEACIARLWGEGWGVHCEEDGWWWVKDGHREPMTEAERAVMEGAG